MDERFTDSVLTLPYERPAADAAPMVVAVEATRLSRDVRGIGRYVRALLPRLVAQRPGLTLLVFLKSQRDADSLAGWFDAIPAMRGRVKLRTVRGMTRADADVFWYPWNVSSPAPASGAIVTTVHDIVPIAHPDPRLRGWQKNLRWRRRYAETARRATLIIADSQFTANEVQRMLGVPPERMRVVLLAADDFAAPPESMDAEVLSRLGVKRPYVLAVGAADRRKNLVLLERAMPAVRSVHPGTSLVLAGPRRGAADGRADATWRQTLGFISDDELACVYRQAEVFVMPSTYEGFGLPVLEAMGLGTPVVCARGSSLTEVAGDAAAWVDGEDEAELARIIARVMRDARVRDDMRAAGLEQASRFSWDETARQTIAAFEEAIAMARR